MNKEQFHALVRKTSRKVKKMGSNITNAKVKKMLGRMLAKDLKKHFKPLLVIYLTHNTQAEIRRNENAFIKAIQNNVGDNFKILILPAMSGDEVRAELWQKGKMLTKFHKQLFENNIWQFHELLRMQRSNGMFEIHGLDGGGNLKLKPYDGPDLSNVQGIID